MYRFLCCLLLLVATGWGWPAVGVAQSTTTTGLPARPTPFQFVTDQAHLLREADAKTLESGLRRYAANTGTQLVVVTVPTLGGRNVADYGRALGQAWGVGQRDKNNGIVVLLSGQEHQLTIQAGAGLQNVVTPALTARVISQMTPYFKQDNYFAGLRNGLNTLMQAVSPAAAGSQPATADAAGRAATVASVPRNDELMTTDEAPASAPYNAPTADMTSQPSSSGLGIGTLLLGVVVIGGVLWLVIRMFRKRGTAPAAPAAPAAPSTPDFLGTSPSAPAGPAGSIPRGAIPSSPSGSSPDFLGTGLSNGAGNGLGNMLMTGAAAAAGSYLGNRMAGGNHAQQNTGAGLTNANYSSPPLDQPPTAGGPYTGDAFPALHNAPEETPRDYFSDAGGQDSAAPDYFAPDESNSYDDPSSNNTGGGGFDSREDNSGSW